MSELGSATWPEIADGPGTVVVVPIGSCEQHGPHLPLGTDTLIAAALADSLARYRPPAVVAPAVAIGASGEHAGFKGTLSIGTDVLTGLIIELVRSADWAQGVVLVNGHGGNLDALGRAESTLTVEGRRVLAWGPSVPDDRRADAQAGFTETSLLLHLAPGLVRADRAQPGDMRPLGMTMPAMRRGGVRAVSANGVLGDPTGASAQAGAALFDLLVADLLARFDEWMQCTASSWTRPVVSSTAGAC